MFTFYSGTGNLTTAADAGTAFTGSTGNDTFNATLTFSADALASTATLTAGDNLTGGTGTDTLNITISGAAVTDAGEITNVTTTGIEKILVSNFETDASGITGAGATIQQDSVEIDLSNVDSSLTTIGTIAGSNVEADTVFANVGKLVDVEMAGKGDLRVEFGTTVVSGVADSLNLTLKGAGTSATTLSTVSTAGIETLNITTSTNNSYLSLANEDYTTITAAGAKDLVLDVLDTGVTSFNASTATGKVTVDLDAITLANLTSVVGGTGTTDVVVIDEAVTVTSSANTLEYFSGFETLKVTDAVAVALSANTAGISSFDFSNAANNTLTLSTGYTSATTVSIAGDSGANADTITNSANVALTVNGNDEDFDDSLTITGGTGVDTLNITAKSGVSDLTLVTKVDQINVLAGTTGTETATVKLDVGQVVDTVVAAAATLTVNASALTNASATFTFDGTGENDGYLNVTGGAGNDSITGGASHDTLTGGTGNDTLTGAAGNDTINGGDGIDTIDAGAGNDNVTAGAGNDLITAGAGNDTIDAGAGNDTITMAGNLTAADTIDGGEGTDTLSVTSVDATALAGVSNVENLAVSSAASVSLTSNLAFTTIDLQTSAANETVTFGTGYTTATTVSVEDGDTVTNTAADIVLTITADSDDLAAADNTYLTGSDAASVTNTINATNTTGTIDMQTDIIDFDVLNILDHATTTGNDVGVDVTSYGDTGDTLTIDASALDAGEDFTMTGAADANLTVTAGAGNDTLVLGAGNDTLTAGEGNDGITAAGNITYQDTIDGGAGTDTMTATAIEDIDFQHVSNVETLTATTSAALGSYAQTAGIATVRTVTTASVTATAMTSVLTVLVANSAQTDTVTLGQGNDVVVFNSVATLVAADTINGTSGNDTIRIDNDDDIDVDTTGETTTAIADAISNIDTILINDTATDDSAGDVTLTMANGTYDQTTLTVDASALDVGEDFTFNAIDTTMTETDEAFVVTGGAGNDSLTGGAGNDTLNGGSGVDTLIGGLRADTLTGGAGADIFSYEEGDSVGTTTDTISDFTSGTDKLQITLTTTGTVDATDKGDAASNSDGLSLLSSKEGQYFFNTTNKQLVMDSDGNGLIQATDEVITLTGATALSDADINFIINATGTSVITTGAGADKVYLGVAANVTTNDIITLGTGSDIVYVTADDDGTGAIFDDLSGVETIHVDDATTADAKVTLTYTSANTTAITIDASDLTNAGAVLTLIASDAEVDGALTVIGSAGADSITTGDGSDIITGGAGRDSLTGDVGNDTFVYASAAHAGNSYAGTDVNAAKIDAITDYIVANDTILLGTTAAAFGTGITLTTGTAFNVNTLTALTGDYAALSNMLAAVETARTGVASTSATMQVYVVTVAASLDTGDFDDDAAGTYLIINDATAAIGASDMIINITGLTGTITSADFTVA